MAIFAGGDIQYSTLMNFTGDGETVAANFGAKAVPFLWERHVTDSASVLYDFLMSGARVPLSRELVRVRPLHNVGLGSVMRSPVGTDFVRRYRLHFR